MNLFKRILFGSFGNYSKLLFGLLIGSDVGRPSHDREFCSRDFGHYTMIAFPTYGFRTWLLAGRVQLYTFVSPKR